jgi:ketosteroid isomerase-like protein
VDLVPTVRAVYDEWERGNYRAGLELFDPKVHFEVHIPIPEAGVYTGVGEMQGYMREFLGSWTDYEIHARSIEQVGTSVIVHVFHKGRASGAPVDAYFFSIWTFDGDRVVRVDNAQDRETGLAAANV